MTSIGTEMRAVIEKCDICVNGDIISKELLLKTLFQFLSVTIEKEKHNVGFILHTGSVCYDAMAVAYAALSNILYDETDPEETINSLEPGKSIVLYYSGNKPGAKGERYRFEGITDDIGSIYADPGPYAILKQDNGTETYVKKAFWNKITPYLGDSTSLDGKGIRRDSGVRSGFLKTVLGLKDERITHSIDTSTIIVMSKEAADELIPEMSFRYGSTEITLTDLVTASYYTEGEQAYQYGASAAKAEPVLKITSKASVARELLLHKERNKNIGLIVIGEESLKRGETELPELIKRKSLQYAYVLADIDAECIRPYLETTDGYELFACTKDFLLSNSLPLRENNPTTEQLAKQVNAVIDQEITIEQNRGFLDWKKYKAFKRTIRAIKLSDYSSDEKDDFVINAYALLNLFMTMPFTVKRLDTAIEKGDITTVVMTEARINAVKEAADTLPEYLRDNCNEIISLLEDSYLTLYDRNQKETLLVETIDRFDGGKIAVVVPKAYYIPVIEEITKGHKKLDIISANRFDNQEIYDVIIVTGNISGSRFTPHRCRASSNIVALLYDAEVYPYQADELKEKRTERSYNVRSTLRNGLSDTYEMNDIPQETEIEKEADEIKEIDNELTALLDRRNERAERAYFSRYGNKSVTEVIATARFDSGESAFFSKNYKAYVLDERQKKVEEVKADDLAEGQAVIFTRSNAKTKDVVDELLSAMIDEKRLPKETVEAYRKSKAWKNALIEHMKRFSLTPSEIASRMVGNGVAVQESTIRVWLDEDAHTVGPRQLDSIQQVALLVGNDEMFDHASDYFEACSDIRGLRRRILQFIAQTVLGEITGEKTVKDPLFESVYAHVDELATILRIRSVSQVNMNVPVNLINRPLSIEEN